MEKEELVTFGYLRESCKSLNIDLLPHDIMIMLVIWVILCDSFDETLSDPMIEIGEYKTETDKNMVQTVSKKAAKYSNFQWPTRHSAFGRNIIEKGTQQSWKLQLIMTDKMTKIEFIIGIIDNKILQRLQKEEDFEKIGDFTRSEVNGYGLWRGSFGNFLAYHGTNFPRDYAYAALFDSKFKHNDTITMTLDLTDDKCGSLSYFIETNKNVDVPTEISNVAFKEVDINSEYRLAVTLQKEGGMLALLF